MTLLVGSAGEEFYERLRSLYRPLFGRIAASDAHIDQMARDNLDTSRSREQLERFSETIGVSLAGKRLLEVGSGVGVTVAVARRDMGIEAFGIEPGDEEFEGTLKVSWDLLRAAGVDPDVIRYGVGEAIPFEDQSFDLVYTTNVLEHVDDPARVVSEIVRVLKPGGYAQITVPNYGSWWEGHYGILWLPHMPAWAGKIYVFMLGRDPAFIDTLRLVTRGKLERWVAPHRGEVEVIDWGVRTWENRVRTLGFSEYSALGRLKGILRFLHRVKVIPAIIAVGKALHWETPLILTFRRVQ